jgi:hypothetical protein
MKKLFLPVFICSLLFLSTDAQYFQGGFALGTNDTIVFKIKPIGGDITTTITYMEFAFRYLTAQSPDLTASAPVNNTAFFGSELNVVPFPPNYIEAPYTYIKFVHNTGTISSKTYIENTEYTVFKIKLSTSPTAQTGIQMASNLPSGLFIFGVTDGAGNLLDPENNAQLYGEGYSVANDTHTVPLFSEPVGFEFLTFNGIINSNAASLTWSVKGENVNTRDYTIEKSLNGTVFTPIDQIVAQRVFNTILQYNYDDNNFYNQNLAYYRIRKNDENGNFTLSNVVMLKKNNGSSFVISPNPSKNLTSIAYYSETEGKAEVSLIDAGGKRCLHLNTYSSIGMNKITVDVSSLASGTYIVIINTGSIIMAEKLIKQ